MVQKQTEERIKFANTLKNLKRDQKQNYTNNRNKQPTKKKKRKLFYHYGIGYNLQKEQQTKANIIIDMLDQIIISIQTQKKC